MTRPWDNIEDFESWQESNCFECVVASDSTRETAFYPSCNIRTDIIVVIMISEDFQRMRELASELGWTRKCGKNWKCKLKQDSI